MKAFKKLLIKELKHARWSILVMVSLSVVLQLLVYLNTDLHSRSANAALIAGLAPLMILPFWIFWSAFHTFKVEWNHDTAYLMLTLPVSGWKITISKLAASLIQFVLFILVTSSGYLLLFGRPVSNLLLSAGVPIGWVAEMAVKLFVLVLLATAVVMVVCQFAYVAGRLAKRFQGLLTIWVFLMTMWAGVRLSQLIAVVFTWVPDIPLTVWMRTQGTIYWGEAFLNPAPILGFLTVAVGLFLCTGWLLEQDIEL